MHLNDAITESINQEKILTLEHEILQETAEHGRGGTPESKVLGPEIYGEFYLPPLAGLHAIRKTKDRFEQIGLQKMVVNATMLDVGCHIGSLVFHAHQLGAAHVTGVEQNMDRLLVAEKIRRFNKIPDDKISFLNSIEDVEKRYDIVTCMSVDDYVPNPFEFYQKLLDRCSGMLIIESNIQEYGTHPLSVFCISKGLEYRWIGEVCDKMPYGKDRTRNLFLIEVGE